MIKVLLADDDFLVRTFLSRITDWEKHGYKLVGAAQDGEEALRMAKEYEPDIIITDISMPVMDGIELIRRLKAEGNAAVILVLSCHDDFDYVKEAMKLGADYVTAGHIFRTDCKKGLEPRGLGFLEKIVHTVSVPVYGIGGIHSGNEESVQEHGAAGVCIMSGCMKE